MNIQSNDVQIEYAMIGKAIKYIVIIFIILPLVAILSLWLLVPLYDFFYHPLLSFRPEMGFKPVGEYQVIFDEYRNAGFIDSKNNMLLIITLPDTGQDDSVSWNVIPKSKSYAKVYSEYGHVVGVRLHKDSFVVVDGVTGEELLVHSIPKEELWGKTFFKWNRNTLDNRLEDCCEFFSIPKEKFHEIQEKVNQHDTSDERERGTYAFEDEK